MSEALQFGVIAAGGVAGYLYTGFVLGAIGGAVVAFFVVLMVGLSDCV